jgi:hypothetical protein
MSKPENLDNSYLYGLFYGDSGAGKTRLMGTAMLDPRTYPLLVLNARGQPSSLRFLDPRPLVLRIESMKDFNPIYDWILDDQPEPTVFGDVDWGSEDFIYVCEKLPEPFKYIYPYLAEIEERKFKCLGIDSITQVQRIADDQILGYDTYAADIIPPNSTYPTYNKLLGMMTKLTDHHFELPIHVIMTALSRHSEMPTLGITKYYPFLRGQSALEVPSYAELVGRLVPLASLAQQQMTKLSKDPELKKEFAGRVPYNVLFTRGGRDFIAKWQGVENPPDMIVEPTITKILDIMGV